MNLRPKREELEVNITPLIDVVFLLLIFFMITTSFRHESPIRINPPESPAEATVQKDNVIEVWIDKNGKYYVEKDPVKEDLRSLRRAIRRIAVQRKDAPLLICADAETEHEYVVKAMNAATQVGFVKVSICTIKSEQ